MKINRPAYIYDIAGLGGFACIPPLSPADINHFYILPTSTPRKPGKGQKEKMLVFWDHSVDVCVSMTVVTHTLAF